MHSFFRACQLPTPERHAAFCLATKYFGTYLSMQPHRQCVGTDGILAPTTVARSCRCVLIAGTTGSSMLDWRGPLCTVSEQCFIQSFFSIVCARFCVCYPTDCPELSTFVCWCSVPVGRCRADLTLLEWALEQWYNFSSLLGCMYCIMFHLFIVSNFFYCSINNLRFDFCRVLTIWKPGRIQVLGVWQDFLSERYNCVTLPSFKIHPEIIGWRSMLLLSHVHVL